MKKIIFNPMYSSLFTYKDLLCFYYVALALFDTKSYHEPCYLFLHQYFTVIRTLHNQITSENIILYNLFTLSSIPLFRACPHSHMAHATKIYSLINIYSDSNYSGQEELFQNRLWPVLCADVHVSSKNLNYYLMSKMWFLTLMIC